MSYVRNGELQDGWRFIDALAFEVQGFEKVWK